MWKTFAGWVLAFFGMAQELEEHRTTIRRLEDRVRDLEEALKLLALEQRHSREIEQAAREKLLLQLDSTWNQNRKLPPPRRKKLK